MKHKGSFLLTQRRKWVPDTDSGASALPDTAGRPIGDFPCLPQHS